MSALTSFCPSTASQSPRLLMKLIVLFVSVLLLASGCANSNERANKLFVEAIAALEGMKETPTSTEADLIAAWLKTSALLEKIIKDYPGSEIAVQLVQNKSIIGGKTLAEFKAMPDQINEIRCHGQLKANGLAALVWADEHGETLPRDYSELVRAVRGDSSDTNFTGLSELVCPKSVPFGKEVESGQKSLRPEDIERIGYTVVQFGLKRVAKNEAKTWLRCQKCGFELHVDGSIYKK